ncbi:MAG: anti-sigma factor antagonist [Calditrichales bacterium]|nr:MAG: anti-sigma factor antagonist [Calditrichales bacterium]
MEISKESFDRGVLLALKGRFDTLAAAEFEQEMRSTIDKGVNKIVVDCTEMDYVSSSTLRVFLFALKTIRQSSGKIVLINLQAHIREVFEISGFLDLFEIFSTKEDALAAI